MSQLPTSIFSRPRIVSGALCAVALLLTHVSAAAPRGVAPQKGKVFEESTRVFEVRVPINVVGRDGEPVRGLTADNFKIFDGGTEREIVDFDVVDLELLEPGKTRRELLNSIDGAARRHFLLLFDLSFSKPTALVRARDAARQFVLEKVHPTDLVAVAVHSVEGGARLLVTFTPDRAQVARAIDTLGAPRLVNLRRRDPLRFLIDDPDSPAMTASADFLSEPTSAAQTLQQDVAAHVQVIAKEMAKAEKGFARGRIASWSRSMGDLARMLDSVQGRKHVVYFSEGFDGRLLLGREPSAFDREHQEEMQNIERGDLFLVDTDDMYGNTGLQSSVNLMLEEFRRADCIIQAVDIAGLRADSIAEERVRNTGQHALFYIANDTGGELFQDANDFGGELVKVLERSSVTYLATFRADDVAPDGAYHRLRIKADLPAGGRVSARDGYYAPRPYEELHPFEKTLLASDAIVSTRQADLSLNVLAAPFRADPERSYVPIIIEAEGGPLLEENEGPKLQVEFYAYVTDARGEMRDFFTQLVSLELNDNRDVFARTGLKYYGHMDLAPGSYQLRVLVRNSRTGASGVESIDLEVPTYAAAEPFLLPPFFLEQQGSWFLVRERDRVEFQRSVIYPFTVNGEPYIPAARPALASAEEARLCLVAYNLGPEGLDLESTIVAEDGTVIEGGKLSLIERTITGIEGLDKLLASFRPVGLAEGSYTLQVALTDREKGTTEINSIPFTLRN